MRIYQRSATLPTLSSATGLLLLLAGLRPLAAQTTSAQPAAVATLMLADALREADRNAFANRIANATIESARARARLTLKGLLPSARVETGVVRTTDPVAVFGTTLRQRLVTPEAFAPSRLNDPAAETNVQSGLVVEVPLFNADAIAGLRAARAGAVASSAAGEWTAITTRANVVRAYFGAVLASERTTALEQARDAANAAVRQVQAMVQQGLVTKADALQAEVRAADVTSQLIASQNDVRNAKQQLALLLGRTDDAELHLPYVLPNDAAVRALAERDTLATLSTDQSGTTVRADVQAAHAGAEAANADRVRAARTLLPRVNSFARYDWNAPSAPFGGRKNWTVGLLASWSLFSGSEIADVAGATARAAGARAGEEAALAQGRVEANAARRSVAVALQRMDLAQRAAEQSREAERLVEKRYAGGLATIAELLGAESSATVAALGQAAARFALIDAVAMHRRAIGADPAELSQLDTAR